MKATIKSVIVKLNNLDYKDYILIENKNGILLIDNDLCSISFATKDEFDNNVKACFTNNIKLELT